MYASGRPRRPDSTALAPQKLVGGAQRTWGPPGRHPALGPHRAKKYDHAAPSRLAGLPAFGVGSRSGL